MLHKTAKLPLEMMKYSTYNGLLSLCFSLLLNNFLVLVADQKFCLFSLPVKAGEGLWSKLGQAHKYNC